MIIEMKGTQATVIAENERFVFQNVELSTSIDEDTNEKRFILSAIGDDETIFDAPYSLTSIISA